MNKWEKRLAIPTYKGQRRLITISEDHKGNVYIRLFSGKSSRENGNIVKEHRYSIHTSPATAEFNTIKTTIKRENESETNSVAYTRAIKSSSGFAPIFTIRFSNLSADLYNLPTDKPFEVINAHKFDSDSTTLCLSCFVGCISEKFELVIDTAAWHEMTSENFKIIFLWSVDSYPPLFPIFSHRVTINPELAESEAEKNFLNNQMNGLRSDECQKYHFGQTSVLLRNALISSLSFVNDEEKKSWLIEFIDSLQTPNYFFFSENEYKKIFGNAEMRKMMAHVSKFKYRWY